MGYQISGNYGISAAPQTSIGNVRFEQFVKSELALIAWRYGKDYGSHVSSVLIAQVLANRQKAGWGTWLDIVAGIPRFSATLDTPTSYPTAWDRNFLKVLSEIDGVVDGTARDGTNGGLFWCDLNNVTNEWFLEEICRKKTRCGDMGSLVFFK